MRMRDGFGIRCPRDVPILLVDTLASLSLDRGRLQRGLRLTARPGWLRGGSRNKVECSCISNTFRGGGERSTR